MTLDPSAEFGGTRWALACLTPDVLSVGGGAELLDGLEELGFEVLAASLSTVRPPEVARLYAHNLGNTAPGRVDGTWLGREIYSLGPSLKLVLSRDEDGSDRALADAKGPSAWGDREPSHLRSRIGLANKSFSMIHTPDSCVQAWDDLEWLFGPRTAAGLRAGFVAPVPWERLRRLSAPLVFAYSTAADRVVAQVAERADEVIATDARLWLDDGDWCGERAAEALLRIPQPDGLALLDRIYFAERSLLAEAARALRRSDLDAVESDVVVEILLRNAVLRDAWAAQLVRSVLVFPPTRR